MSESRLVFALDLPTLDQARAMAHAVHEAVGMFKVGLELFVEAGPRAVTAVAEAGRPVFLDLKLHDIPETVESGRGPRLGPGRAHAHRPRQRRPRDAPPRGRAGHEGGRGPRESSP